MKAPERNRQKPYFKQEKSKMIIQKGIIEKGILKKEFLKGNS